MRTRLPALLLLASAGTVSVAQTGDAPSREELLKAAVSRERGDVAAMEASGRDGGGVYIGHASGAVLNCVGADTCTEFGGTPKLAIRRMAVSTEGRREILWVSYRHGAIYRCVDRQCTKVNWNAPH